MLHDLKILVHDLSMLFLFADQTPFVLFSKLDNRTLEMNSAGSVKMQTYEESNLNQQWVITDIGDQWMNVGLKKPMEVGNGRNWILGEYQNGYLILDKRTPTRAIDRGWVQEDGRGVGTYNAHGAPNQRFEMAYMSTGPTTVG